MLGQALPLSTETLPGAYRDTGADGCLEVSTEEVELGPGTARIEVPPGPPAEISLRRFADAGEYPVHTGGAAGGDALLLRIPADRATQQPWFLHVEAGQGARVCP